MHYLRDFAALAARALALARELAEAIATSDARITALARTLGETISTTDDLAAAILLRVLMPTSLELAASARTTLELGS